MSRLENLFGPEDMDAINAAIGAIEVEDDVPAEDVLKERIGAFTMGEIAWIAESNPYFANNLQMCLGEEYGRLVTEAQGVVFPVMGEAVRDDPSKGQIERRGSGTFSSSFDIGFYVSGITLAVRATRDADEELASTFIANGTYTDSLRFFDEPSASRDYRAGMLAHFKGLYGPESSVRAALEQRGQPDVQLGFAWMMGTFAMVDQRIGPEEVTMTRMAVPPLPSEQ